MSRYITESLRELTAQRTNHCCEYCRLPANRSFFAFHIDHIVSLKHGGDTTTDNLSYACAICNVNKGASVATLAPDRPSGFITHESIAGRGISSWSHLAY
jgi:5-methylcytosine-specific restriction endonuclease McrA